MLIRLISLQRRPLIDKYWVEKRAPNWLVAAPRVRWGLNLKFLRKVYPALPPLLCILLKFYFFCERFWVSGGFFNHFFSIFGKMRFNGCQDFHGFFVRDQIDGCSFAPEPTRTTDAVQISFEVWLAILIDRHIIIHNQTNVVYVDPT